jgi:hypothetical protein
MASATSPSAGAWFFGAGGVAALAGGQGAAAGGHGAGSVAVRVQAAAVAAPTPARNPLRVVLMIEATGGDDRRNGSKLPRVAAARRGAGAPAPKVRLAREPRAMAS